MDENQNPTQPATEPDKTQSVSTTEETSIPPTGRRLALRNVRRQLTDEELAQSGTQKMLLDMLEEVENERENLKGFVTNFYESDKRAAILSEKLITDKRIEVFFGGGVGLGGALLGLAPFFWDIGSGYGFVCLFIGVCLIIFACIGRAIKK